MVADLPHSDGEAVAKEMGDSATFVPTDVSSTFALFLFNSDVSVVHS